MDSKWNKEKENLEKLILKENKSYEEIGRSYNCSGSNIKKVSQRLGINLPKRRKINPNEIFNKGAMKSYTCKTVEKRITQISLSVQKIAAMSITTNNDIKIF